MVANWIIVALWLSIFIVPAHLTWWLVMMLLRVLTMRTLATSRRVLLAFWRVLRLRILEVRRMDRAIRRMWMSAACVLSC